MKKKLANYSSLVLGILILFSSFEFISSQHKTSSSTEQYEQYDEYDESTQTQTTTDTSELFNPLEHDYEEEDSSMNEDHDFDMENSQPYQCPSQCKCVFNKPDSNSVNRENDETSISNDYDEEEPSPRLKRASNDYEEDYSEEQSDSHGSNSHKNHNTNVKYDIHVDCSNQMLTSISYLFSDDFPLDQIVSFNLSNNKFRSLRLDDGFEDLTNLKILDLSSNINLKSLSPRNFLKKFRHLEKIYFNNLNQINCDQRGNSNKLIPIDCKWLRTLLYLYKRNITIQIDKPIPCDIYKLVNSVSLMSRCFSDLYNSYRFTDSNQTLLQADNSKYEFRIEPELNQILIEGDTLELTCKLKRLNLFKKYRKTNFNFYRSQIKWYLNDNQQLMISTIYYTKDNPTQIQIIENKSKFKQDDQIESKLIITNTISTQHTGRFTCVASLFLSDRKLNLNTSKIEIKVLSRQQLNILETNPNSLASDLAKSKQYCPEIITQTYKGIYKWPRTLANSKITQKCAFNPNTTNNRNEFAIFECLADGKWSDYMELSDCHFESNLTRYLNQLTKFSNSEISLENFIKKIVSIQSSDNSTSKTSLNMYDIIFIQKYLLTILRSNKTSYLESNTIKHEFLFLNDMLSRLNEFYVKQAQLLDSVTFSDYFFNALYEIVMANFEQQPIKNRQDDMLSSYLATLSLSKYKLRNSLICKLEKYHLSQQIYFKCEESNNSKINKKKRFDSDLQTSIEFDASSIKKLQLILFENDKLFPTSLNDSTSPINLSNYELINLVDYNRILDSEDLASSSENTCSQILGIVNSSSQFNFNLTLEVKIPEKYYRVLGLIRSKVINKSNEILLEKIELNKTKKLSIQIEKERNLFDQIFSSNPLSEKNSLYLDLTTNGQTNNVLLVNKNLKLNSDNLEEKILKYDKYFLLNTNRLRNFRNLIVNTWFNLDNYNLLYGQVVNSKNKSYVQWSTKSNGCKLGTLETSFNESYNNISSFLMSNSNDTGKFRLFAKLNCNWNSKLQFLGLRHSNKKFNKTNLTEPTLTSILNMIDEYARLHRLDINEDLNSTKSIMTKLNSILMTSYQFFDYKIVYFSSILSSVLLFVNILIYILFNKSLMMPRSFYHSLLNTWISILLLILLYTLGINQIYIAHLCLFSGVFLHYLSLCSFIWYLLYFWSLYNKLSTLEKRNFNLIFNPTKANQINDNEDDQEYIPKPVIHLYMLGWGVPLLLICIIISITKREYIQLPFSFCFTNEPNILIGSILIPIGFISFVQLILVGLIGFTLRKIYKDLEEEEILEKKCETKLGEEKKELCKNWVNSKIEEQLNDLKVNEVIEIKMNPQTQKSLIINASKYNNEDSFDASNTSLTNSDSDRTSVMDTQHKPQIQLKFSILSWFLFVLICLFAFLLTSASSFDFFLENYELLTKIFSYLMSLLMIIYSILQISFYVLSREDILMFNFNFTCKCLLNSDSSTKSGGSALSAESISEDSNIDINKDTNWYFEPKVSNEDQPPREKDQTANFTNLEESSDDDHKKSISDAIFSARKTQNEEKKSPSIISNKSSSTSSGVISNSEATSTNRINSSKSEGISATLAMQEDLSEYASTAQNSDYFNMKKIGHVRNPSSLSGSNTIQSLQINTSQNDSIIYETNSIKKNPTYSKRPPYVFLDYKQDVKQEIQISPYLTKENRYEIREEEVIIEDIYREYISNASVNSNKNKLEDLLTNSCTAQTGTAIESIACLARNTKSSLSNVTSNTQTYSTSSSSSLTEKPKPRRRSNGSTPTSFASSSNDSNLHSNSANQFTNVNLTENTFDDSNYQLYSSLNKNTSQHNTWVNAIPPKYQPRHYNSTLPSSTGARVYPKANSRTTRNGSLLRTSLIRTKELDLKNETSV